MAQMAQSDFGVYVDVKPKIDENTFKGEIKADVEASLKKLTGDFKLKITPSIDEKAFEKNINQAISELNIKPVNIKFNVEAAIKEAEKIKKRVEQSSREKRSASYNELYSSQEESLGVVNSLIKREIGALDKYDVKIQQVNTKTARWSATNRKLGETIYGGARWYKDAEGVEKLDAAITSINTDSRMGSQNMAAMGKSAATLSNKIQLYLNQNTALAKKAPQVYNQLRILQRNLNLSQWDDSEARVRLTKYGKTFQELQLQAKTLGAETESLYAKFKNTFTTRIRSIISATAFSTVVGAFASLKQNVTEIDDALTQLKIVTGQSDNTLAKYFKDATVEAKKFGNSITDIIGSTETYARLGYSLNESLNLSSITNQFANVAAIEESDATTAMTSILKAYNKLPSEAEFIADKLVKVGQDYAVSASELGVALENGGSALAVANTNLDESIALIAAGNASVQDASKVGNALKTLSAYIRGSEADLESLGETTEGTVKTTSKLQKEISALTGGKVSLLEDDGETYRSVYDIMVDIASVWDSMSDKNRATLLEDIAGKLLPVHTVMCV